MLLVDDNADALEGLALLLQMAGNEVLQACDGVEAIRIAAATPPDLVLLDLGMPAWTVTRWRDASAPSPGERLPLVALSGWGQSEDIRAPATRASTVTW